jgi:hypothetical protein
MQSVDHDDDDLQLYVAAFRDVEQPTAGARAATWRAIERETAPPRRWLWVGAVAMLAAAAWLVLRFGAVELAILGMDDPDASRDQAGYLPDEEEASVAEARRPAPTERPRVVVEPAAPIVAPVVEPVVEAVAPKRRTDAPRPAPSLAEETKLFGEIQQALVEGKPSAALAAIARHEREFPRGAFRLERVVAKAQALCASGKTTAAARVRDQFLAKHGASHLAPRMRAVCPR